ncbi:MAG: fibrobacter succinogenes major paralogous domain-containing protein, partial [Crocinitomicaceae bacterium]|nr:fibrobacter succinogenes major paralogous domain-containing protein [Crocinitomicaceae bacterium]
KLKTNKNEKSEFNFKPVVMTAMMLSSCGEGASNQEGASNEVPASNQEGASNEESASHEVTIGNQVWMVENLNVDKFRNGDPIPEAKTSGEWEAYSDAEEAAWCYYDNDPTNGEKYGKLYNWYAVNDPRGLAPEGWHVPSDEEWTQLTDYLGGSEKAGAKMKSKNGWANDGNGTNSSGFSGLPGGFRGDDGTFYYFGDGGSWWCSTEYGTGSAWGRYLSYYNGDVDWDYGGKEEGLSVRCLRD